MRIINSILNNKLKCTRCPVVFYREYTCLRLVFMKGNKTRDSGNRNG